MMNYFDEIHVRVEKYREVHKKHLRIAALKMVLWNMYFFVFPPYEKHKNTVEVSEYLINPKDTMLNVAFLLNGGIGDFVILINYIYKFKQKYECPELCIDIFYDKNRMAAETLIDEKLAQHHYYIMHDDIYCQNIHRKYDLFIDISRYPNITNRNFDKIRKYCPQLLNYMLEIEKFNIEDPRLMNSVPAFDGQSAMIDKINNIKRIQQGDIGGLLEIKEEYEYSIPIRIDEKQYLEDMGLLDHRFIIIVSGADANCGGAESNKLWAPENYDSVLTDIKKRYPDIITIQTGTNKADYRFKGIDMDLVGKTTLEDTKVLLKQAYLLIGNEGGMVHLRHAVHGGLSIVLFSSTDEDFFGYSENINIRGDGCPHPCEWLYDSWQTKCINKNMFACMKSITPEMVLDKVYGYIAGEDKRYA